MKNVTLEAFQRFIEETYRTVRAVADMGMGADLSALNEAKDALWDALQNEHVTLGSMTLLFELTMPNRGSWNGAWSGERRRHLLIRKLSNTKKNIDHCEKLVGNYHYHWPDGWGANVECSVIEPKSARYFRKLSDGFCGYDWMVDSILSYGKILAGHEIPEVTTESATIHRNESA